ncbi:MAG: recombinase family protein [Phycisphaerae bacterium]|nr:recombinase family protein [Phycisphaerae bacterium]
MIQAAPKTIRCAIYTRKSTEENLGLDYNTLDAQRDACEAYIKSQKSLGWVCLPDQYDDGGYTGGNMDRPAFQQLMADVEDGKIDCIAIYKIDRLSRSLMDFAQIMEVLERKKVSLVSVTQQFNTTTSMGRLTLNILLSFAQFEREIISERTRDKIAASRRKGKWTGGHQVLGYDLQQKPGGNCLLVNQEESYQVQQIFKLYLESGSIMDTLRALREKGIMTKQYSTKTGNSRGGAPFDKTTLHRTLTNVTYLGKVRHKDQVYEGEHEAIIDADTFHQVQGMLKRNLRSGGKYSSNKYNALLKGLVRCKHCGSAMIHHFVQKPNKRYRYYVCLKAQKQGWDTCPSPALPAAELEQFIVDQIKVIGKDLAVLEDCIKKTQAHMQEQIERLKDARSEKQKLIQELSQQIGEAAAQVGFDGTAAGRIELCQQQIKDIQVEMASLNSEIVSIQRQMLNPDELVGNLESFEPLWDAMRPRQKEKLIHLLIKQIEWDSETDNIFIAFHQTNIEVLN